MSLAPRSAAVAIAAMALSLAACESESTATGPEVVVDQTINKVNTSAPLNASSSDTLVYFSFDANTLVPASASWDIALRRYEIRLNSAATAGTNNRGVTAYSFGNNATKTDAQIIAFTTANTLPAFDSVRVAQIPADSLFKGETLVENRYAWLNLAGAPTANATAYWKVRTAAGSSALVRFTRITYTPQQALDTVQLETRLETGGTLGAARPLTLKLNGAAFVNVATGAAGTGTGCDWDLRIDQQQFAVTTNTACNTGTYPGDASPTFANQTRASDAPQLVGYLSALSAPIPNSITATSAPFRYNLEGTNRLHPVFNTYLIKVAAKVYKLQVINYYSDAGASAFPTLRWSRIK